MGMFLREIAIVSVLAGALLEVVGASAAGRPEEGLTVAASLVSDIGLLARLREQTSGASSLRVAGPFGLAEIHGPELQTEGLQYSSAIPLRLRPGAEIPPAIPWDEIREIQVARSAAGRGAAIGAMVATLTVVVLFASTEGASSQGYGLLDFSAALVTVGAGAGVGALIGSPIRRWERIFPPAPKRTRSSRSILKDGEDDR